MATDPLAALIELRDQSFAEVGRAKRDLEKAKAKVKEAETKYSALTEAVEHVSSAAGGGAPDTRKDRIYKLVLAHDGEGLTARDILKLLEAEGLAPPGKNPSAAVHVAADQLVDDELIISEKHPERGKIYKRPESQELL